MTFQRPHNKIPSMNKLSLITLSIALGFATLKSSQLYAQNLYTENWLQGPIEIESQFPADLLHSSLRPQSPKTLQKNSFKLGANFIWSNGFNLEENILFDSETRVVNLNTDYGVTDSFQVGLNVPIVWRGAGVLDNFITQFHDTFGLPQGNRERQDQDLYQVTGRNSDGSRFSHTDTGTELGDITLRSKYLLTPGNQQSSAWSLLSEVRLPTATANTYGQDAIDIQLGILGSKAWQETALYWGASYIYFFDQQIEGIQFDAHNLQGFLGLEYALSEKVSLLTSFLVTNAALTGIDGIPGYTTYIDIGAKYKLNQRSTLEFLLRENPAPSESTIDASFLFGISYLL